MKPTNLIIITLATSFVAATSALAQDGTLPPASTKTGVTYAMDIQPIFETACVKCHGAEKPKARLRMDTLEGVLKGTKQGKIIVLGDSAKSLLVKSVAHLTQDRESWMPPLRNKAGIKPLTAEQIGLVRAWIDQGAK